MPPEFDHTESEWENLGHSLCQAFQIWRLDIGTGYLVYIERFGLVPGAVTFVPHGNQQGRP